MSNANGKRHTVQSTTEEVLVPDLDLGYSCILLVPPFSKMSPETVKMSPKILQIPKCLQKIAYFFTRTDLMQNVFKICPNCFSKSVKKVS